MKITWLDSALKGFFFLILALFALASPLGNATEIQVNNYTFKDLGWSNSVTLNGYAPSNILFLPIPKTPSPLKATLHLKIAFSASLADSSRLEIKFNQTVLRTIAPPSTGSYVDLDIELPLTNLSDQWQELNFVAYLRSANSLCTPDVWIYVLPESTLSISVNQSVFSGTLNAIDQLFLNTNSINPISLLLLLSSPRSESLFLAFDVAQRLGQLTQNSKLSLNTAFMNFSSQQLNSQNVVLIGTAQELNQYPIYSQQIEQKLNETLQQDKGYILLEPSPYNPFNGLLTFTGADFAALHKAVAAFMAPDFDKIIAGHVASIDSVEVVAPKNTTLNWENTTLTALDYSDQTVMGLGHHTLSYTISLPTDEQPRSANIKTLITYPAAPGNNLSQITLVMNGQKQSVLQLSENHTQWSTQINSKALKPGANTLEYVFDLHLEHEECTMQNYNQIWATIYSDTEITILFDKHYPFAALNQFPVPFSGEINVILPNILSAEDISDLNRLFFKLGQLIPAKLLSLKYYKAADVDEPFIRLNNVLLYGTPNSNHWVQFALQFMPVSLENNNRVLKLPNEHIAAQVDHSTGLLELMNSPWHSQRSVFVLTGTDQKGLGKALNHFIDDSSRLKLNGNIAFINVDNSVEVINTDKGRYVSLKDQFSNWLINQTRNIIFFIKYYPQIFAYLLVFLVPLLIFIKRYKKK